MQKARGDNAWLPRDEAPNPPKDNDKASHLGIPLQPTSSRDPIKQHPPDASSRAIARKLSVGCPGRTRSGVWYCGKDSHRMRCIAGGLVSIARHSILIGWRSHYSGLPVVFLARLRCRDGCDPKARFLICGFPSGQGNRRGGGEALPVIDGADGVCDHG
jgi:hypothetical protein